MTLPTGSMNCSLNSPNLWSTTATAPSTCFFVFFVLSFVQLHLSGFSLHDNKASAGVTAQHLIQGFSHVSDISRHLFTVFNQAKARMRWGEVRVVNLSDHWKPVHQPAPFSGKQCQLSEVMLCEANVTSSERRQIGEGQPGDGKDCSSPESTFICVF